MSKNERKYPEYIMEYLRMRYRMDDSDKSKDDYFRSLPCETVFSEVLQWNGLLGGWDTQIKRWIIDIYGIDIDEKSEI